jgi:hypothetical protein
LVATGARRTSAGGRDTTIGNRPDAQSSYSITTPRRTPSWARRTRYLDSTDQTRGCEAKRKNQSTLFHIEAETLLANFAAEHSTARTEHAVVLSSDCVDSDGRSTVRNTAIVQLAGQRFQSFRQTLRCQGSVSVVTGTVKPAQHTSHSHNRSGHKIRDIGSVVCQHLTPSSAKQQKHDRRFHVCTGMVVRRSKFCSPRSPRSRRCTSLSALYDLRQLTTAPHAVRGSRHGDSYAVE